jgi:hypothetical protein
VKSIISAFVFLMVLLSAEEVDLSRYETSFYSQNGEDGILKKIFELIEPSAFFCVELGASDGVTGSPTYLLRLQGWNGLLLDRAHDAPSYQLHREYITAKNINELLGRYNVFEQFDLLCINMSYNGFYYWNALDSKYRPSVILIKYNATHLPHEDKVVMYHPFYLGNKTDYFGASILALYQMGRERGYSLVYAEKKGMNLFFIRDEILKENNLVFKDMNEVEKIYRFPIYHNGGGLPPDLKKRPYLSYGQAGNK